MITFQWNGCSFDMIQYGRGRFLGKMAGHSHAKHSYELHYIVSGRGTLTTPERTFPLTPGTFFVTGPQVYHQQSPDPDAPMEEAYFYLRCGSEKSRNAPVNLFLEQTFYVGEAPELWEPVNRILEEERLRQFGYRSAIGALMQLLLTMIVRLYVPQLSALPETAADLNDQRFLLIERAFIDDPEGITLGQLADRIGLCPRQTQRLLRSGYGMSFTEKKRESIALREQMGKADPENKQRNT